MYDDDELTESDIKAYVERLIHEAINSIDMTTIYESTERELTEAEADLAWDVLLDAAVSVFWGSPGAGECFD